MDVVHVRRVLFTVSAVLAALSGVLLARWQGVVVPEDAGLVQSVQLLGFAIVGGLGSLAGPVLGASLLTWLSTATSGLGNIELLVYGLIFFFVVAFLRGGVAGLPDMVRTSQLARRLGLPGSRARGVDGAAPLGAVAGEPGSAQARPRPPPFPWPAPGSGGAAAGAAGSRSSACRSRSAGSGR